MAPSQNLASVQGPTWRHRQFWRLRSPAADFVQNQVRPYPGEIAIRREASIVIGGDDAGGIIESDEVAGSLLPAMAQSLSMARPPECYGH
jgi:hypothetical protein